MRRGSLADERPDLLSEWSSSNEISPSEVSCGSHKKVQWRCSKGHEWQATVKNRALIGSGCPYCSCRAVLKGFNDLASIHPELVEEWSDRNLPLSPTEVSEFSNKKVWWKCKEGHEWYALISSRSDGHGCPYCAGQLVYEGYNDLNTTNPQIAAEWSERNKPLLPNKITAKNTQNVWWCCSVCGNEYKAVISSRVKGRTCPFCNLIKQNEERIKRLKMVRIESDFKFLLPQLASIYYAGKNGLKVVTDDEDIVGLRLSAYIPDISLVIDTENNLKRIKYKSYLLYKNNIKYINLSAESSEEEIVSMIKQSFVRSHVYFNSNVADDLKFIKEKYISWAQIFEKHP